MKRLSIALLIMSLFGCNESSNIEATSSGTIKIDAPAELISLKQANIGPPSINKIWQYKIEYLVPENSLVKTGDVVVRFDTEQLESRLFDEKSKLAGALKEKEKQELDNNAKQQDLVLALAEAKMEYERAERKVAITDESLSDIEKRKQKFDFDIAAQIQKQATRALNAHDNTVKTNTRVINTKIASIERKVMELENSIAKLTVVAPKEGLVVYQADWQGNKPATGETISQGTTVMTLPSIDQLAVKAEFDESDTSALYVGQNVKVTLDAHPEKPFAGKILSLGQAYRNKSRNNFKVVFDATIVMNDAEQSIMRPGMKARVSVMKDPS